MRGRETADDPTASRTWISVSAASALLGVSPQTLRRWDRSGALPAQRHPMNNYRVYDEARLRAWMAERAEAEPPPRAQVVIPRRDALLVGRASALASVDAAVAEGHRLVVVLGPPGVGKSRLARAWMEAADVPNRTFCAAGSCRSVEELALVIGSAIGASFRAAHADALAQQLERALEARAGEVLILDEIENLDEAALQLVGRVAARGVIVVATSRVRPRLANERLILLAPLDYPASDDPAEARQSSAVSLLIERARSAGALPVVDDEVLRHAAAIVRRLEGLPLAVELAASRTTAIGLQRLRRELDVSIDRVGAGAVDAPAAHRTIRAAVSTSIERLGAEARATLEAASLLPQGFDVEELEALVGEGASPLEHLQTLVDHSMISARQSEASTELSFSIHTVIREVVLEQARPDRAAQLEGRHAMWRAAEAARLAADRSSQSVLRIARAEEGLKRAWSWTMAHLDLVDAASASTDIARALGRLVETFGPSPATVDVLARTIEMARERGVDDGRRAELAFYEAISRLFQSELTEAHARYEEARTLARKGGNPRFEALTCCQLAWLAARVGDVAARDRALDAADEILVGHSDPFPQMLLSSLRAQFDLQRGLTASARRGFERARALAVRLGDGGNEASASGFLGAVAFDEGAPAEAVRHYERAIDIATAHDASIIETVFRGYRAIALHQLGDPAAELAYAEALACTQRTRSVRLESLFRAWRGAWSAGRGDVDEANRLIDTADALSDAQAQTVCALHRGHVDLARADRARRAGRQDEAQRHEALAYRRLDSVRDDKSTIRELRVVRRFLEHAILMRPSPAGSASLVVGWQGRWLESEGAHVSLHTRVPLQRITWELSLRRILEPGMPVSVPVLVAAAWPEERVRPDSAAHRVQVAISTLRRLGLRDAIESSAAGYMLAPSRTVHISRTP